MTDLKICRICLIQDVKMFRYVKIYYEEIVDPTIHNTTSVPQWFCFECAAMLQKIHKFRQKCFRGLGILKELLKKGSLSRDIVSQIDRQTKGLESLIQMTQDSNIHIKTYGFTHKKSTMMQSHRFNTDNINDKEIDSKSRPEEALKNHRQYKSKRNNPIKEKEINTEGVRLINFKDETMSNDDFSDSGPIDADIDKILVVNRNHEPNTELIEKKHKNNSLDDHLFQRSVKRVFLNPEHWKKFILTDEDAQKEFKAKELNVNYVKANYKCTDCFRGFSTEEMIKRHMKIKHCKSLGQFECRLCHMRVKWKSMLTKHLKQHYTRYKCLRCELSFPVESSAFKHDEFHNGVTRTCPHCGEEFRHLSSYYTHLRQHRSKIVCPLCGLTFLTDFGLLMHTKVKHVLVNTEASKTDENLFCEVCDIKFVTRKAYEEHLSQSAMHTLVSDEKGPQPFKWKYSQRRVPRKYTTCPTCGQNFSTYVAYSRHHSAEHPDDPLLPYSPKVKKICEICGASVAPMSLAAHINSHTKEKRYKCDVCSAQRSSKGAFKKHLLTHAAESKIM